MDVVPTAKGNIKLEPRVTPCELFIVIIVQTRHYSFLSLHRLGSHISSEGDADSKDVKRVGCESLLSSPFIGDYAPR